jgi:hypothetical protein
MARASLDLIEAMKEITKALRPITGRGVGYRLFARQLLQSMSKNGMQRVYRLLKEARERGMIPWQWVVDETSELSGSPSWDDPEHYARSVINSYRRDYWTQQLRRVEVWSEKGTVSGILSPVLDEYGVEFMLCHGFASAGRVKRACLRSARQPLIALYVGDYDPSGMWMSERDLPERLKEYGGKKVSIRRIALVRSDLRDLPSFPASDKETDTRYPWFVKDYGDRCWELDAMDPNDLRARAEQEILEYIEPKAWERCKVVERAEQRSLVEIMKRWGDRGSDQERI